MNKDDGFPHGEYRGYLRHRYRDEEPCEACREARNTYVRELRSRKPELLRRQKRQARARTRALSRLARLHPADYLALMQEEYRRE